MFISCNTVVHHKTFLGNCLAYSSGRTEVPFRQVSSSSHQVEVLFVGTKLTNV